MMERERLFPGDSAFRALSRPSIGSWWPGTRILKERKKDKLSRNNKSATKIIAYSLIH